MPCHDPGHDRQPETRADLPHTAVALVQHRSLEGHREVVGREARPSVADLQHGILALLSGTNDEGTSGRSGPQGVVDQAVDRLAQPIGIGGDDE